MQKGLIRHPFYLFEGVNAYREGNRTPKNTLFYAENSRFFGGRWMSRKGYSEFGDAQSGGTNIKGLMGYERFPSGVATPYVVSYYNEKFYRYDIATAADVEINPAAWTTEDINVEGVSYNSNLYVADGVNLIGKINDTAFSTIADSPRARLLAVWAEKMWAVDNVAPATMQYSATATAAVPLNVEDWTTAGATGAELLGKGGRIESVRVLDQKMYAFKRDDIEVFTTIDLSGANPRPVHEALSKGIGSISHRATTIVDNNDIWFLSPNLEINSLGSVSGYFENTRARDISAVIQRYKRDLDSDQTEAVGWYENGLYKLALKENGSSQNNILFVFDKETGGWSFDRATSPQVAETINGVALFGVGGNSGQIYRDESGYSDNGFPMAWSGRTGLVDDGRADLFKYARYLFVRGVRSEGAVITVRLLGEDFEQLEEHTIPAPTDEEIAAGGIEIEDAWRQVGDIVGSDGFQGDNTGSPAVYRFNYRFSVSSTARMFGAEIASSLLAQVAAIDEIELKYIPRPDKYGIINA